MPDLTVTAPIEELQTISKVLDSNPLPGPLTKQHVGNFQVRLAQAAEAAAAQEANPPATVDPPGEDAGPPGPLVE